MELTSGHLELNAGNIQPKEPIWTSQNSKTRHGPYAFLKALLQIKLLEFTGIHHWLQLAGVYKANDAFNVAQKNK